MPIGFDWNNIEYIKGFPKNAIMTISVYRLLPPCGASAPMLDEKRKTLDLFWNFYRSEKDFVLVDDFPDTYKLTGQDEISKTYSFPKSYASYHKPRAVSTEQRERARQMMITRNKITV